MKLDTSRRIIARAVIIAVVTLYFSVIACAKSDLSTNQARKLIATMAGFNLNSGAVHILDVRSIDPNTAQADAELTMAFRFEGNSEGQWTLAEVRVGQEQWEGAVLLVRALKTAEPATDCKIAERGFNNRRARCLLSQWLGIQMPSDAVRIKSTSTLALPLSSTTSALVEALVTAQFQFTKSEKGSWRVSGVRTGTQNWIDPQSLLEALNAEKTLAARANLQMMAQALEIFRIDHGSYVATKSVRVLFDFLSPHYVKSIVRLDPWRHPYLYEGTIGSFTLRSVGADGKENTADDLSITSGVKSAN